MQTLEGKLPVGLISKDKVLRNFVIRKISGIDEENMSAKAVSSNVGKLVTALLFGSYAVTDRGVLLKLSDDDGFSYEAPMITENMVNSLCAADRDYLIIKLKQLSSGDELETVTNCPKCQEAYTLKINLNEISVKEGNGTNIVEFDLPESVYINGREYGKHVTARFITGFDQIELSKIMDEGNAGKFKSLLINRCLLKLGDTEFPKDGSRYFSLENRNSFLEQLVALTPGPDLSTDLECTCGFSGKVRINFDSFFTMG